jgi:penicillin-binding protein 1B
LDGTGLSRSKPRGRRSRAFLAEAWRLRWVRVAALILAVPIIGVCFAAGYYYVTFARLIDGRLHGERVRVLPRVFARPLELRRGQALTDRQLIDRLNDLGYTERPIAQKPGEFEISTGAVAIMPRAPEFKGQLVHVNFQRGRPVQRASRQPVRLSDRVEQLSLGRARRESLTLDAPVLSQLGGGEREKRRPVALSAIPQRMIDAVLAIEDRRFYDHPGFDPIGIGGAVFSYATGRRGYLAGASTVTQQVVRNVFLPTFDGMTLQTARERSLKRKALEIWVSVVLTSRATKDEILEMYLNDVPLGQRGSFAIFGVPEAARLFFGKDITNVSLAEAATIAGVIQQPSALSPFNNPERCQERRNVVLSAMADAGLITDEAAAAAAKEPLTIVPRALEAEAPYFVDYVGQTIAADYPGLTTTTQEAVDVYTTLDLHLQRLAQDAVRNGLMSVDKLLSKRRRKGQAEAALIAVDPKTGEILAMVGGRSYNQSQYNRAIVARRQPGSVFKPFVYLAAFEAAADDGRTDVTPASIVDDAPTTWEVGDEVWAPENYEQEYDGLTTYRHALAHSRNIAAVKVAEATGFDRVAQLWKKLGVGTPLKPYPSIALGVFEVTPLEIATAYTIFPNMGVVRPPRNLLKIMRGGHDMTGRQRNRAKAVARPETAFLVTDMLRSVINEGTGYGVRAAGFKFDAGGKTGTTNDLRDAWFVGFTPDLLTVVWVGFDDNQAVGLSGSQAALPIWTEFMTRALAGRQNVEFEVPTGVGFVDIDPINGQLAVPGCPKVVRQAFVAGSEPLVACELHR